MFKSVALSISIVICLAWGAEALAQAETQVPQSREQVKLSYAPLVARARPAVVNIFTQKVVDARVRHPLLDDPFFRQFFGDQLNALGGSRKRVQNSLGSGVILHPDGVIVTNHHVIQGADDIKVVLHDNREFQARVVGSDERTDLAVLKIDAPGEKLPALVMGDSDALEVGDLVLAIGNPFGVGQTVTSGIVSATARTSLGISDYQFFIQTDAAINPGNSGGALVDLDGKLVGINTAIFSKSGGSMGLGFAIPVNMVRAVVFGIVEHGKPVRPWFGASGQPVTPDIAASLGLKRPTGVLIRAVFKDGPADKAGLKVGDVVLRIDAMPVDSIEALRYRIATTRIGKTAALVVLRDGKESELGVQLVPPPETPPRNLTELDGAIPLSGTRIANLNPALAEELGLDGFEAGVIVLDVDRNGIAARLGFEPGDLIVDVNGRDMRRVEDVKTAMADPNTPGWVISFKRGDNVLTVKARNPRVKP